MEENGLRLNGIRLDSGDLAYLSKECRRRLNDAGLQYVKIAVSNQLDEYIIRSLVGQQAPIDVFGVGTSLVTGQPDAALDGVYKLAWSNGKPRIKLSENVGKITLPYKKQVYRCADSSGKFVGADVVTMAEESTADIMHHPMYPLKSLSLVKYDQEALLHKVMENGLRLTDPKAVSEIAKYSESRLEKLPDEYKRFDYPHIYKIGISTQMQIERDKLINEFKK